MRQASKLVISSAGLLALCAAVPMLLYGLGLLASKGRPNLPLSMASAPQQQAVWAEAKGVGQLHVTPLNPFSYFFSIVGTDGRIEPSALLAWRVGRAHLRQQQLTAGARWHLSAMSLTIWLTRNWSAEELTSKLVELREQNGP